MERRLEMLMVLAVVVFCVAERINAAEPLGHWKLDETDGTIAYDSAGDNDGTLINGPVWTTGVLNGALEFDGIDDYVNLSQNAVTGTEFTVAAWANQYGLAGGVGDHDNKIFLQRDDRTGTGSCGIGLTTMAGTGYAEATLRSSTSSTMVLRAPRRPYGEWHHYAMTVDSDDFIFYIDGVEVDSKTNNQSGDYVTSIDHVYIGRLMYGGGLRGSFNGAIDDVIIYDRALSSAEIEELYLGEEPELVGLEIAGPDEAAEDSQTQYSAIAIYDNNTTADVTHLAKWSVEPNLIADIEEGLLATDKIFEPQAVTITAEYTEADITAEDAKEVSIFAICPTGTALEFDDEDDYVEVGDNDSLDLTVFSIGAWFKVYSLGDNDDEDIIEKREVGKNDYYLNFRLVVDDYTSDKIGSGIGTGSTSFSNIKSDSTVDVGIWTHVTVTYDRMSHRMYVNGILQQDMDQTSIIPYTSGNQPTRIGVRSHSGNLSSYFNGIIDEVAIYNRALSAEEVHVLMHTRPDADEPNLVGYWDFDEGEGQVAYDLSSNANHGQLGAGPDADDSDPAWVDSDAPVGICTPEGLVERNVNDALEIKLNILEQIGEALLMEDASVNILSELFGEAQYGHLDKRDIIKAKQEIHSAIQGEEQAIDSLEKSAGDLEDSLEALSGQDGSPESPPERQSKTLAKPAPSAVRKPSRR